LKVIGPEVPRRSTFEERREASGIVILVVTPTGFQALEDKLVAGATSAVDSHGVAVGIGEGEGDTEWSLERLDQNRDPRENHCIVQVLRIVRLQPDGHTPPEVVDSVKIDEWLSNGERYGLRGEYHGVVGTRLSTSEAEVPGVKGCGSL
jgi:hypothetical protein